MYILILILSLIIIILASTGTWLMPDLEAYAEQYRVEQAREAYNPKACIGFGVESDVCGTRLIPQDCANITDSGDIIADVARQMCPYMCGANCTTTSTTGSTTTRTSTTGTTTTTIRPHPVVEGRHAIMVYRTCRKIVCVHQFEHHRHGDLVSCCMMKQQFSVLINLPCDAALKLRPKPQVEISRVQVRCLLQVLYARSVSIPAGGILLMLPFGVVLRAEFVSKDQ